MKSMKIYDKWMLLFTAFLILFSACSKEDDDPVSPQQDADAKTEVKKPTVYIKKKDDQGVLLNYKSYVVDDNFNIKDTTTKSAPPDSAQKMWDEVKKFIPETGGWRKLIVEFQFAKEGGGAAHPIDATLSKWAITLSPSTEKIDNYHLICHEFGHILSLRSPQLDPAIEEDDCTTFSLSEGCATDNSYIYRLFKDFWKDIYVKYPPLSPNAAAAAQDSRLDKIYKEYKDRFLGEYSATNITEDMAEVYANFVISDKPDSSTTSGSEKKMLLLYNFPELVLLRNYARKTIYSE